MSAAREDGRGLSDGIGAEPGGSPPLFLLPRARDRPRDAPADLFAIEAKRSLSRLQIALWLSAIPGAARPLFKVMPMELMLKRLAAGMMDGMVAPAPWGQLVEPAGCGKLEVPFETGAYAQQVALVCQQNVCQTVPQMCRDLPAACAAARRQLTDPAAVLETASWATAAGWPQFTPELLRQSAARYPGPVP